MPSIYMTGTGYDQVYGYDWQGNVTGWNGSGYAYDGMDRLTTGGYTYDVIGNQSAAPGSTSYTYIATGGGPSMRLDYKTVSGVTTDYTDDGHLGNLVTVAGTYTNLTYDATNRLMSITDVARSSTDQYRYGPEGLRYRKVEGSTTTYFLYEGNELLYEEGYEGSTREACRLNVYVGGVNVGRVTKEGSTERVQYFYLDHLGSKRAVTDASGNVQAKIDYSVWGVASVTNYNGYDGRGDISYTGKERDQTGLYYFNARYYDPSVGRFITEDPTRNGLNWFVYCNNNPLSFVDPTGLRLVASADGRDTQEEIAIALHNESNVRHVSFVKAENAQNLDNYRPSLTTPLSQTTMLVTQLSLIHAGIANAEQACHFLSIVAGPLLATFHYLTINEVISKINEYQAQNWLGVDFRVNEPSKIENDIAVELGLKNGGVSLSSKSIPEGVEATIRRGLSFNGNIHSNLGDSSGRFLWEPWDSGLNRIPSPAYYYGLYWE